MEGWMGRIVKETCFYHAMKLRYSVYYHGSCLHYISAVTQNALVALSNLHLSQLILMRKWCRNAFDIFSSLFQFSLLKVVE